ncbi:MAG: pyruvate, phosphate dikinase [Verrucomicrobia bacterium]|nr:pyruvate, phosphate dikinase [Verrucomicrobiota bacterium]
MSNETILNPDVLSTGLAGLDEVLLGLQPGDNVVWEVDRVEDYRPVAMPFREEAQRRGRRLVYFRFARHLPLFDPEVEVEMYAMDPEVGFESFVTGILDVIERVGANGYYVFDCLSDLAVDWFSDRMLATFYQIVCPYVYELKTLAYFGLLKDRHPVHATDVIMRTAQVVLEVFRKDHHVFMQPLKVFRRHSPTLYLLHAWENGKFRPVTNSATITEIRAGSPQPWLDFSIRRLGVWTEMFQQAQAALAAVADGRAEPAATELLLRRLLKMVVTRDERLLALAGRYLGLGDVVGVMQRMIGSGLIGGKSLGMLLARAILDRADPQWSQRLEKHDSFFIGSDVFNTYLVENGCWWLRRRPRESARDSASMSEYFQRAGQARVKLLQGAFPDDVREQFREMLEYFGQSPIIVRSSSLLEDSYGNAFSGKYESVFCANQGTPQQRLEAFMAAVRTVYASTMSQESLQYRLHHGLLDRDEQMALLVQRVSGEMYGRLFFPQLAGVGFSFNPFVWHEEIDPTAGFLRLVFGLGTRAVDRSDDDYTRLVALNAPLKRPDSRPDQALQHAQRRVDVLDLEGNLLTNREYSALVGALPASEQQLFSRDPAVSPTPDFERLLVETEFIPIMRELLRTVEEAYQHAVDIEFTANTLEDGKLRVNLLQCRPFQVKIKGEGGRVQFPDRLRAGDRLLESRGPILGHSLATAIDRLIYVPPATYSRLSMSDRYAVARAIGRVTLETKPAGSGIVMLLGPGRWGTSMPALGVPVSFAEISRAAVLGELTTMHEGLVPDVSLGTHFFNDLVEMDILYFAVSPNKEGHMFNEELLKQAPNRLLTLLPGAVRLVGTLWVVDATDLSPDGRLYLNVDSMKQRLVCYRQSDSR